MAIRLRMNNPTEIRRTLSRIGNLVVNKQLDSKTANTIVYCCNSILSCLRTDEQQKKIDELEMLLEEINGERKVG